jgi:hypothetical protein
MVLFFSLQTCFYPIYFYLRFFPKNKYLICLHKLRQFSVPLNSKPNVKKLIIHSVNKNSNINYFSTLRYNKVRNSPKLSLRKDQFTVVCEGKLKFLHFVPKKSSLSSAAPPPNLLIFSFNNTFVKSDNNNNTNNNYNNIMEDTAHNTLINIIQKQTQKESQNNIWINSPYKDLVKLQSNNVGNVGEELINTICKLTNIPAECDGSKTKQIGGGEGDGTIMGIPVEIKTAHQGSTSPSFQHELGEVPWKGSRYMIFVDISPNCIYLTIFANFDEETYKSKKKLALFPSKSVTWRKKKGAFKLDTSVKINEQSVETGNAIKITPTTTNEYIASFIQRIIV